MDKLRYIFADTETTGVGTTDKVCEVAYTITDEAFNITGMGYSLINPGKPIHYAASAVNGITDAMVADAPTLDEFFESQGQPFRGDDVVIIAHNAPFDMRWLGEYTDHQRAIDTLRVARILYPDAENHKQGTLAAMLGIIIDRSKAHAADGDIDVLIQVVKIMCAEHNLKLGDLEEVQKRKRPIKALSFGKHKGVPIAELPSTYVHWLLNKAENLDPDIRAAVLEKHS